MPVLVNKREVGGRTVIEGREDVEIDVDLDVIADEGDRADVFEYCSEPGEITSRQRGDGQVKEGEE